jgi:hypothetical protein
VRNIFTIFLGAMFYTENISLNEWLGYTIALGGFAAYNVAKSGYWDKPTSSLLPVEIGDTGKAESVGEATPLSPTSKKKALEGLGLKGMEASTDEGDVESSQPLLNGARNNGSLSGRGLATLPLPQLQVKLNMTTGTTNQKRG